MRELYHGTLAQNVPSIIKSGLLLQKGLWTSDFHSDASELVYAVDDSHRGKLITIITGQIAKCGLLRCSDNYLFDDFKADLMQHGAVVIIRAAAIFRRYPDHFESGHPPGTEPGDWYSREPVSVDNIQRIMTGQGMLDWLEPSECDFTHRLRDILCSEGSPD